MSSAGSTSTVDRATAVTNVDAAAAAGFSGEHATTTTSEAPVAPFSGVVVGDPNANSSDTLTIQVSGAGGVLTGAGLSGGQNGTYALPSGTAGTVQSELEALVFTPAAGAPDTQSRHAVHPHRHQRTWLGEFVRDQRRRPRPGRGADHRRVPFHDHNVRGFGDAVLGRDGRRRELRCERGTDDRGRTGRAERWRVPG